MGVLVSVGVGITHNVVKAPAHTLAGKCMKSLNIITVNMDS